MIRRHNHDSPGDAIVSSSTPNAPGQKRYNCKHCDGYMWLSPSSQQRLKLKPSTDLICLNCLITKPELQNNATLSAPSDELLRGDLRGDPLAEKIIDDIGREEGTAADFFKGLKHE